MAGKNSKYVIGIDLGGTKILAATVGPEGRITGRAKLPTGAKGPRDVMKRMVACAREALKKGGLGMGDIRGVGIGAPGPLDPDNGVVLFAPNLPGWKDVPVKAVIEKSLKKPVFLDNDVNVGTLGEHVLGVGRGVRDLVGIFVGTGIGGGVIMDGRLHRGLNKTAGEIGHMIVEIGGPRCGCGNRGCLEAIASRSAISRDIAAAIGKGKKSKQIKRRLSDPASIKSSDISRALKQGDRDVEKIVKRAAVALGIAAVNIIHILNPEMIVLGGGVVEAFGDHILPPVRKIVKKKALPFTGNRVQIVPAELGDDASVLGASVLARQRLA